MGTTTDSDLDLALRARAGEVDALQVLVDRHLHPAWRVALAATSGEADAAAAAVVAGFADGLTAAATANDAQVAVRVRIVAATRRAAVAAPVVAGPAFAEPVLRAFAALPERWRTVLWLTEVEGGTPEQVAPVLGIDRSASTHLAGRAAAGLRERLAADAAERAEAADCRRALSHLPKLAAAGRVGAADRAQLEAHLGVCSKCALVLSALVQPRPALRRLVVPIPADLAARVIAAVERRRRHGLAPWAERAIGAAAAAVLAVGLAGAALLVGRDRGPAADLAVPAGLSGAPPSGDGELASAPLAPVRPADAGSVLARGTTTTNRSLADQLIPPQVVVPDSSRPNTDNGTPPPAPDPAPPPDTGPGPIPVDDTQVVVSVGGDGGVTVAVGDCTGASVAGTAVGCIPEAAETIEVAVETPIPGAPTLRLP